MSRIMSPVCVLFLFILLSGCGDDAAENGGVDGDETPVECLNSSDCDNAEICIDHNCLKYCNAETACTKGVCDMKLHACISGEIDGDGETSSGDCNQNGCSDGYYCHTETGVCIPIAGGDEDGDGEISTESDDDAEDDPCSDTKCPSELYDVVGEDCVCVPNAQHCINAGCEGEKNCDEESGYCNNSDLWPGMCDRCYSDSDCPAEGSICSVVLETQEHFCSPTCRSTDPVCPTDSTCTDVSSFMGLPDAYLVCLPDVNTCGNPHMTGGSCASDDECSEELYCITEADNELEVIFPSGYCSRLCESDDDCLSGSRCTTFTVGSDKVKTCTTLCSHQPDDCRSGYTCFNVSNTAICIPETLVDK